MKFRPCIDIHEGKVKQIVGSTLSDGPLGPTINFETDLSSAHYANMYKQDGLTGGHVIMLGSGNSDAAFEALRAFPGGLQIGGGITPENARMYLDAGASHVIVTSYIFKDGAIQWDRLKAFSAMIGKEKLVLDLSCKKRNGFYWVVTDRWQKFTESKIEAQTLGKLSVYCDEFLIHAADVEGMQAGIDSELVLLLGDLLTIPATYAGGIRSISDIEQIRTTGNGMIDITIGSALDLFGGSLHYKEVLEWFRNMNNND